MNNYMKIVPGTYENDDAITNTLTYIFHWGKNQMSLPIYFCGLPGITNYPPAPQEVIKSFMDVRKNDKNPISRQVWHLVISFPFKFAIPYGHYFYFVAALAYLFAPKYPVAYAYHTKNKGTSRSHSHFHLIISTSSSLKDEPALDAQVFHSYIPQMVAVAKSYGLTPNFIEEETYV